MDWRGVKHYQVENFSEKGWFPAHRLRESAVWNSPQHPSDYWNSDSDFDFDGDDGYSPLNTGGGSVFGGGASYQPPTTGGGSSTGGTGADSASYGGGHGATNHTASGLKEIKNGESDECGASDESDSVDIDSADDPEDDFSDLVHFHTAHNMLQLLSEISTQRLANGSNESAATVSTYDRATEASSSLSHATQPDPVAGPPNNNVDNSSQLEVR